MNGNGPFDPRKEAPLLSAYVEPTQVRKFLQAGVYGYILKDDDYVSHIESIVRDLAAGRPYLSPQAYEALAQATQQAGDRELLTDGGKGVVPAVFGVLLSLLLSKMSGTLNKQTFLEGLMGATKTSCMIAFILAGLMSLGFASFAQMAAAQ